MIPVPTIYVDHDPEFVPSDDAAVFDRLLVWTRLEKEQGNVKRPESPHE